MHVDSTVVKRMGAVKVADILNNSIKEFGSEIEMALNHIKAKRDRNACPHCANDVCNGGYNRFRMKGSEPSTHRYESFVQEKVVNKIKKIYALHTNLLEMTCE